MQAQGMPVHECASPYPQPLSLPMPGPRKAYQRDCAEYRPIPGGGPADNPANHRVEVVYAGDYQANCNQDECVPPLEECTPPGVGWRACCVPTNLACALLLCTLWLCSALYAVRCPKGHRLQHWSRCALLLIGRGDGMHGAIKQLSRACYTGCHNVDVCS